MADVGHDAGAYHSVGMTVTLTKQCSVRKLDRYKRDDEHNEEQQQPDSQGNKNRKESRDSEDERIQGPNCQKNNGDNTLDEMGVREFSFFFKIRVQSLEPD